MQKFQRPHVRYAAALLCAGLLASTWGCREVDEPCPVVSLMVMPDPLRLPANSTLQIDGNSSGSVGRSGKHRRLCHRTTASLLVLQLRQTPPGSAAGIRGWAPAGDMNVA